MSWSVHTKYAGACHLLARLSGRIKNEEDLEVIKMCLDDFCKEFPGAYEVIKTSDGGWGLELIQKEQKSG